MCLAVGSAYGVSTGILALQDVVCRLCCIRAVRSLFVKTLMVSRVGDVAGAIDGRPAIHARFSFVWYIHIYPVHNLTPSGALSHLHHPFTVQRAR